MPKRSLPILLVGLVAGFILTKSISFIYAQVVNGVIHGCVRNGNGLLRVITSGNCLQNETSLDWNQQGPAGATGATGAGGGNNFKGYITDQLINGNFNSEVFTYKDLRGLNFSGSHFSGVYLDYADFSDANMSGTTLSPIPDVNGVVFVNTNFSNASLSGTYTNSNFGNSNLTNSSALQVAFSDSNFGNANFTGANLRGASFSNCNLTGVTWSNTICPDGTQSSNNGNTCIGHLTP